MRKHSHFQTPLENPSIQTHLVLLCCIKRLCIFGPKGAIQIRYYYYYYYYYYHLLLGAFIAFPSSFPWPQRLFKGGGSAPCRMGQIALGVRVTAVLTFLL